MGSCGSKQTGGANTFYGDGDVKDNSSEAEERQPTPKPTRAPSRAPSRANLFYNDGDDVEEETTSCFGSKSSKGAKGKAKKRGTKNKDSPKSSRGKSGNAGSSPTNQTGTLGGKRAWWEFGENQQDPQNMNKYDAILFHRKQRIDKLLDRNPRQRAMQDSHDEQKKEQRRQQECAEQDRNAYLEKCKKDDKEKTSCFAGLCKPKSKRVGATNFHNQ